MQGGEEIKARVVRKCSHPYVIVFQNYICRHLPFRRSRNNNILFSLLKTFIKCIIGGVEPMRVRGNSIARAPRVDPALSSTLFVQLVISSSSSLPVN